MQGIKALVTGGGSGLGSACVRRFLDQGAKVVICDLANTDHEASVGKNCVFHKTDVTKPDDVRGALSAAMDTFGGLNAVVNCAGIGHAARTLGRDNKVHKLEDFERVMKVNAIGTFNVARLASEVMAAGEDDDGHRGVIVNTASVAAYDGQIGQVAYSASKGAIVGMTLPMARDLAHCGIRVVTIAPGLFATPLLEKLPEKVKKYLATLIPFPPRLGDPDEFAHLAQHITLNRMLNGCVIRLDGALRMPP